MVFGWVAFPSRGFISEKLKKAVVVSEGKPRSVHKGRAIFQQPKNLGRDSIARCRKNMLSGRTIFPPPTPKSAVFTFGTWFRKKSPY